MIHFYCFQINIWKYLYAKCTHCRPIHFNICRNQQTYAFPRRADSDFRFNTSSCVCRCLINKTVRLSLYLQSLILYMWRNLKPQSKWEIIENSGILFYVQIKRQKWLLRKHYSLSVSNLASKQKYNIIRQAELNKMINYIGSI
jgi:hypothetical protein